MPDANPSEYIHVLQYDESLLANVTEAVQGAFRKDLIINWGGGTHVWFHVGKEPTRNVDKDRVSKDYLKELNGLPRLQNEGDGIKSFVGCLLGVHCGAHKILLIDEPEAFLHPPQARKIGQLLAESAYAHDRQIIAATHSADVIQGALMSKRKVSVCRIERKEDTNNAYVLDSKRIKELWSKPLLQSTGAINGIFHKGVIVCEADGDCRFYESLISQLEADDKLDEPSDLYLIHGGGKGEVATLVKAYKSLNVPTCAITDFDILRNKSEFKKVLKSVGAEFLEIESEYNSAKAGLDGLAPVSSIENFARDASQLLKKINSKNEISKSDKVTLSNLMANSSKWSEAKRYGIDKLKSQQHIDCRKLLEFCKQHGLFIIPKGELESWWREGPSDKTEWPIEAIEQLQADPSVFKDALEYMLEICQHFDK